MHVWIVLAAFALAAVTPYISVPAGSDGGVQLTEDTGDLDQAIDEDEERPS